MIAALLVAAAAATPYVGEQMTWEIRYMGVMGGWARARAESNGESGVRFVATVDSAPWYESLYSIHDEMISTWLPGYGSRRYQTRFREGTFHQDQDMVLDPEGFTVHRRQRDRDGWREWSDDYPAHPGAEDPVSAIQALRLHTHSAAGGDAAWTAPVFTGKETWTLVVKPHGEREIDNPLLGTTAVRVVELFTAHTGDLEQRGRFLMFVTDDARRIPVRVIVRTNFGPVRADLVEYTPPSAGPVGADGPPG